MSMPKRIPSIKELERNSFNAATIVDVWHRDTLEEIQMMLDGTIFTTNGRPISHYLRLARARLRRINRLADHFGIYVDNSPLERASR